MEAFLANYKIIVPPNIYIKDPEHTDLGQRIIKYGVELILEIGFDAFTFRKLGTKIKSNESSIYRYFENKHKFLVYLSSVYWGYMEYEMVLGTYKLNDPIDKLDKYIDIISKPTTQNNSFSSCDQVQLYQIMINENSKSFLTNEVDSENKDGYFLVYKRLIQRFCDLIETIAPDYQFKQSLSSSLFETSLHQHFLASHFPKMTSCNNDKNTFLFLKDLVFKTLELNTNDK